MESPLATGAGGAVPDLLPARMLNEFPYCPRLFHLEWAQGEWADNADTVNGRRVHKRVDRESGDLPPPLRGHVAAAPLKLRQLELMRLPLVPLRGHVTAALLKVLGIEHAARACALSAVPRPRHR